MRSPAITLVSLCLVATACSETTVETSLPGPTTTTLAPSTTTSVVEEGPIPVIVDYSPTVSDVGGLLALLSEPGVEVLAISLPVTGEAGCDLGVQVTLGIIAMMEQRHIPVACDPAMPDGANPWPDEFLEGNTNLVSGIPKISENPYDGTASELIVDTIEASQRPVAIYAVGPLTNVARTLSQSPELVEKISEIVIMGGAVDVPGNVFDHPAEWNFYVDAAAAAAVIGSGAPVTLVALDATNDVPVPSWYPTALARAEQTDQVTYLRRLVDAFPAVTEGFFWFWDELAALVLTGSTDVEMEAARVSVIVGGDENGRVIRDPGGHEVMLATGVGDPGQFYQTFISNLAGAPIDMGQATPEEEAYLLAVAASLEELEVAFEKMSESGVFGDNYDGDAIADAIEPIFPAIETSFEIVQGLDPPASLADLHRAFLDEARNDVDNAEAALAALREASSWQEAEQEAFSLLSTGEDCLAMAEEAFFLGVDARFACEP